MVSFDFSKASDRVPHNLLIYKLKKYNFDNDCINWICAWLKDRKSAVSVNGGTSNEFNAGSGVPQGSVLGPLLFIIYINDISNKIKSSECRLYADDTLLSCTISDDIQALQNDVNCLYEWSQTWGMLFNHSKCTHLQIGKNTHTHRLYLGTELIPATNSIKYLGIHIESNLNH